MYKHPLLFLPHPSSSFYTPSYFLPTSCTPVSSRTRPTPRNIHPLRQTTPLLPLDIHNIRVAPAPAPNPILLRLIPLLPVRVFFFPLPLVQRRLLEPGLPRQLACRRVRRAVLDRRVAVAKVAEVVDVARGEERAGREGVDWCVAPLVEVSVS